MELVWLLENGTFCGPYLKDSEFIQEEVKQGARIEPVESPKAEMYFQIIDEDLESENYHSMIGMPSKVFEAIRPYLSNGCELAAAEALASINWRG